MKVDLPDDWRAALADELDKPYFQSLSEFVDCERDAGQVFPPEEDVFRALSLTPFQRVRVMILGQDPYHDDGQAHGLSFSVRPGVKHPPSLVNIFKELEADLGYPRPKDGSLIPWAEKGVLMLNAVLTVRAHQANSHKSKGWEKFTDAVIRSLVRRARPLVFLLWGGYAQKKAKLILAPHRTILGVHPSPLSASKGFFSSKPFSKINDELTALGDEPIDWRLTES